MKKYAFLLFVLVSIVAASCIKDRIQPPPKAVQAPTGDTLMYYWSFNSSDSSNPLPDFGVNNGAYFLYYASYIDFTTGSSLNLYGTDSTPGECLRVRNPSDSLIFYMPTTGYDSISFSFAVQRSSSGPAQNAISYTTDGTNYVTTALSNSVYQVDTTFELHTFNFASDPAVKHNSHFAVKITFTNNNTGTSGNDRFDNVSLSGVRK